MFFILIYFATFLIFIHLSLNYNRRAVLTRKIPGTNDRFIFGNAFDFIKSPVELFSYTRELAKKHNGIYRFWSFQFGAVFIYNPEDIEVILSSMKHHQKSQFYDFLKPWLKDGLLLSYGKKWQERRKILTPAFHFNILRRYFARLETNTGRLKKTLNENLNDKVDIVPIISEYTLNSICESAMGTTIKDDAAGKSYKKAIHVLGYLFIQRCIRIQYYINYIYKFSSFSKQQNECLSIVHNFTRKVINDRKKYIMENGTDLSNTFDEKSDDDFKLMYSKKKKIAMLDLLITAEKDGLIDSEGIEEEVDTFMFEGHDTTASGLTYCLMLIANHPDVQDKIVAELKDIYGDTKRATTIEDFNDMRYMDRCIKEVLRLYPPVPIISRQINEEIKLSNYTVPAGTLCHIHIYDLHRNESCFPNPTKFDPDRFLPENISGRHHYAYIPFSAGPRNCIGQKFAMMQMKYFLSAVLRNYEVLPVTSCSDLRFQSDLVLRNSEPVYARFVKRKFSI
ncbi:cytochrome P450 4C1-like [Battus philenor]|uniref:cytochrome P450 4C1-like n=1 Tax=Battus philenor TaxID=42288 RepID=UPI0035CF0936